MGLLKVQKNQLVVLASVLILISIGGGVYIGDANTLQELQISIQGADFPEIGLTYCTLYFVVNISNPNSRDVLGVSADFTVNISDVVVGTGHVPVVDIPRNSFRLQRVSIRVYYSDVASAVVEIIKGGHFDVEIDGVIRGKVLFGLFTVSEKISSGYSVN